MLAFLLVLALALEQQRLEVRRSRRRRACDLLHREVVLVALLGVGAAEEPRPPLLDLEGGHEDVREGVLEPRTAEVVVEHLLGLGGRILLVEHSPDGRQAVQDRTGEDLPSSLRVELRDLLGGVLGLTVLARLRDAQRDDPARRGAGDKVEQARDRPPRASFHVGEHQRWDDPADPSSVDGQNPERSLHVEPPFMSPGSRALGRSYAVVRMTLSRSRPVRSRPRSDGGLILTVRRAGGKSFDAET